MTPFKCIIVEDEPLAAEVLSDYVNMLPQLDLVEICPDAIYALEVLNKETIDVIFLDIHLPKLKGLDFLKTLHKVPQIILTTAYHQYAIDAFELDVVDYLLKPIGFQRFLKAVNKLKVASKDHSHLGEAEMEIKSTRAYQYFKVNKKNVKVFLDEILFIESLKEYVCIHTSDQKVVTKFQLGEIANYLNWGNLLRIHRSFLVAKDKIEAFSAHEIELKGHVLPIGRSYKELVMKELDQG